MVRDHGFQMMCGWLEYQKTYNAGDKKNKDSVATLDFPATDKNLGSKICENLGKGKRSLSKKVHFNVCLISMED